MKLPTLLLTRSALGRQKFADLNSIEVGKSLSLVVFILVLLLNVYNDQSQYKLPKIKRSLTRNFGMTVQCDSQTVHASSYLNLCTFLLSFLHVVEARIRDKFNILCHVVTISLKHSSSASIVVLRLFFTAEIMIVEVVIATMFIMIILLLRVIQPHVLY